MRFEVVFLAMAILAKAFAGPLDNSKLHNKHESGKTWV